MKVLVLKPSSLGDIVQALPVARLIRLWRPQAEIHWWVRRDFLPLLDGDPDLAQVIPFDRARAGRPAGWPELARVVRRLRAERYDWVLDLQSLARSALLGWAAGGGTVVGLADPREGAPALHDVSIPRPTDRPHAVDWYLAALGPLGVPASGRFEWLPVKSDAAGLVDALWPGSADRWVAFAPGARWATKRWPVASFAAVARRLTQSQAGVRVALLGGEADRPLGAAIRESAGPAVLDLTGRLSLPAMVEWLRRCDALVTNDTGPMHVAAALGKPVVSIFGPTAPGETGPYGQEGWALRAPGVACAPCQSGVCRNARALECLTGVTPDRALEQLRARLGWRV